MHDSRRRYSHLGCESREAVVLARQNWRVSPLSRLFCRQLFLAQLPSLELRQGRMLGLLHAGQSDSAMRSATWIPSSVRHTAASSLWQMTARPCSPYSGERRAHHFPFSLRQLTLRASCRESMAQNSVCCAPDLMLASGPPLRRLSATMRSCWTTAQTKRLCRLTSTA